MTIDKFIEVVSPKLPSPVENDFTYMSGKDLKLTGYGTKGNTIEDNQMYKVPVPTVFVVDHKKKLSLAWLRGGKPAVRTYLLKYLDEEVVEQAISVI